MDKLLALKTSCDDTERFVKLVKKLYSRLRQCASLQVEVTKQLLPVMRTSTSFELKETE